MSLGALVLPSVKWDETCVPSEGAECKAFGSLKGNVVCQTSQLSAHPQCLLGSSVTLVVPSERLRPREGKGPAQVPKEAEMNPELEPRPQLSFPAVLTKHRKARNSELETQSLLRSNSQKT